MSTWTSDDRAEAAQRRRERAVAILSQLARAVALDAEGVPRTTIAERLGVSRITLWRRMRAIGMTENRVQPETRAGA
jgi:DNA-binding NtrC family response regulator